MPLRAGVRLVAAAKRKPELGLLLWSYATMPGGEFSDAGGYFVALPVGNLCAEVALRYWFLERELEARHRTLSVLIEVEGWTLDSKGARLKLVCFQDGPEGVRMAP